MNKPIRKVVCAVCKYDSVLVAGARHFDDVMRSQLNAMNADRFKGIKPEQGFIDQFGVFMGREEALRVAMASGQPLDMKRNGCDKKLYSEGIY